MKKIIIISTTIIAVIGILLFGVREEYNTNKEQKIIITERETNTVMYYGNAQDIEEAAKQVSFTKEGVYKCKAKVAGEYYTFNIAIPSSKVSNLIKIDQKEYRLDNNKRESK